MEALVLGTQADKRVGGRYAKVTGCIRRRRRALKELIKKSLKPTAAPRGGRLTVQAAEIAVTRVCKVVLPDRSLKSGGPIRKPSGDARTMHIEHFN